ncbi:hypothetical protein KSF_088580 [Reticulibacter mediterranei]|uniref:Uncharacterized protein n=1 Tax=Reticulibacter mediterranei TaxID=2778369 RepID=A0A8J3IUM2_9CHLR|nr:hypothetical protein KSF_088580 [Reticulibacter mediterranei]
MTLLALFWQFTFTRQNKQYHWSFSLPWIEHLERLQNVRSIFTGAVTKMIQEAVSKHFSLFT